jgi:hypothetical protein
MALKGRPFLEIKFSITEVLPSETSWMAISRVIIFWHIRRPIRKVCFQPSPSRFAQDVARADFAEPGAGDGVGPVGLHGAEVDFVTEIVLGATHLFFSSSRTSLSRAENRARVRADTNPSSGPTLPAVTSSRTSASSIFRPPMTL